MRVAYWKLRRLAPRSLRVLERRKEEVPALSAFGPTLIPHAKDFIAAYDAAAVFESRYLAEKAEGREATRALVAVLRAWKPLVARDVPGFDGSDILDKPRVADDVQSDASRFYNLALDYVDGDGQPLSYLQAMGDQLNPAIAKAGKEVDEAEAADGTYRELMQAVRLTARTFNEDLKAFRRTFGNACGRSDVDYQKLRAEKARVTDADDDPGAPGPADPVKPAAPGAPGPAPAP